MLGFPDYKKSDDPPTADLLERLHKFKESAYKCGVQILLTVVLLIVAVPKPWFTNTLLFWSECSTIPCDAVPTLGERFIYCLELAFYLQAIPMIFLWETKRKDRWELLAHHIATVVLIAYSYYLKWVRFIHADSHCCRLLFSSLEETQRGLICISHILPSSMLLSVSLE